MGLKQIAKDKRKGNRYLDQRCGEDRRHVHHLGYFAAGGKEQRGEQERRKRGERREDCVRVTQWSSVCIEDIDE